MTPAERARAEAITAAISQQVKTRKQKPVTAASLLAEPKRGSRDIFYVVTFVIVSAAHVFGFLGYQRYKENEAEKDRLHAQQLDDARTQAAYESARTKELLAALADAQSTAKAYQKSQYATQPQRQWDNGQQPTRQPAGERKIEYNVYKEPRQRIAPQTRTTYAPAPAERTPAPDYTADHRLIARAYLAKKKGVSGQFVSIEQVPGWDGRYRTKFEIPRNPYSGSSSMNPRRFEVITQEKDGKIEGVDATITGY